MEEVIGAVSPICLTLPLLQSIFEKTGYQPSWKLSDMWSQYYYQIIRYIGKTLVNIALYQPYDIEEIQKAIMDVADDIEEVLNCKLDVE